ncbi:MAG: YceI family protein [Bacteroidales bacterium]|nr:YceI family protein [Bacteroidales bacterium]
MKTMKITIAALATFVFMIATATTVKAQSFAEYQATNQSQLSISGTSSLHEWHMKLDALNCKIMGEQVSGKDLVLKNIDFEAKVSNLKSNESSIMDNKAYKAMKEGKYPTISFTGNQVYTLPLSKDQFSGTVSGMLSIAGKKKQVEFNIKGNSENGVITVEGDYPLKMTDFGIDPPTAFFGTLKTGDQIKVHFKILLKNNSTISSLN